MGLYGYTDCRCGRLIKNVQKEDEAGPPRLGQQMFAQGTLDYYFNRYSAVRFNTGPVNKAFWLVFCMECFRDYGVTSAHY